MREVLKEVKRGLLFVVSAPAGTGKTTLVRRLCQEFPSVIASISYTTRQPREGEIASVDYHFITLEEFKKKIATDEFLEYVQLYGDYYGTSRLWVEGKQKLGKHVVLVIDTQGAAKLRGKIPFISIFISPPSLEELKRRLVGRQTDSDEVIKRRLEWAKTELAAAYAFDYQLVNDDLEIAYQNLKNIFIAENNQNESAQR